MTRHSLHDFTVRADRLLQLWAGFKSEHPNETLFILDRVNLIAIAEDRIMLAMGYIGARRWIHPETGIVGAVAPAGSTADIVNNLAIQGWPAPMFMTMRNKP